MSRAQLADVERFVRYVLEFYGEPDFWYVDRTNPTEEEVRSATAVVLAHYREVDRYHRLGPSRDPDDMDLSSHCREVVRDIILMRRGFALEDLEWRVLLESWSVTLPPRLNAPGGAGMTAAHALTALDTVAIQLRDTGYDVGDEVVGCLVIGDDTDAGDIAAHIEDRLGSDVLGQLRVYDEVVDPGDPEDRLRTTVVIEPGAPVSPDDRYRGRFDDAVADAAEAMVQLNRYAGRAERRSDRDRIYHLKDGLLEVLYDRDFCTGWWIHEQDYESRGGYFNRDGDDLAEEDEETWEPPVEVRRFVAFRFVVRGKTYTWRSPEKKGRFHHDAAPRLPDTRTPVDAELPPSPCCEAFNLTEALDLVRYVVQVGLHGISFGGAA